MAIILPHRVLFRGGVENRIRRKLLDDGHIDTVIGLPANLFYSLPLPEYRARGPELSQCAS
jgi:type I restriction enzyme M protein